MNYFIDFEATQFSNEIISIGCVNSNGDEFYTEVKAKKKISAFITSLTGITDEQNKAAPTSDYVFAEFFDWLMKYPNERATFYCYGNTDINFVKKNLENTKNIKAQAALSMIGMNLHDYASVTKIHFGLVKNIALIKLVAYYRGVESIDQSHNALQDALFLKEVFDHVSTEGEIEGHPFPDYELIGALPKMRANENGKPSAKAPRNILKSLNHRIEMYDANGEILVKSFNSIGEARKYVMDNKMGPVDRQKTDKSKIENKIINAYKKKVPYNGQYWKIIVMEKMEDEVNE